MHYDSLPLIWAEGITIVHCRFNVLFLVYQIASTVPQTKTKRMLTHGEYCTQLRRLCDSTLQSSDLITNIRPLLADGTVLFQTALPSAAAQNNILCYIEFKICYSHVYQEPQLLFRLWRRAQSPEDQIDFLAPWFPPDVAQVLGIDDSFTVSLDAFFSNSSHSQETWFAFHPCDTAEIVGDKLDFKNGYLSRWLSIFLLSWLAKS